MQVLKLARTDTMNIKDIEQICKELNLSEDFKNLLIHEEVQTVKINCLPLEPYYKVVNKATFERLSTKVERMKELMTVIDSLTIEQSEIIYRRNKIPAVIDYKKIKSLYNSYLLEYESLISTCEHIEKLETDDGAELHINPMGFKIRKHLKSMQHGQELKQVRLDYRTVLSHQLVVTYDELQQKLAEVESNAYYQKCVKDYNALKAQKSELRKELANLKKSLSEVRVAKKCALFSSEERDKTGNIKISGIQWVSDTYKSKRIITY